MIDVPVLVKDALKEGAYRKNYRFIVLNDDGTEDFTIDNNTLVSESVNIDERMCSGDKIKFGLCEGSSLEFQYFNHPNITGRQLKVFVDVDFIDNVNVYTNVEQVSRWGGATVTEDGSYRVFSAENEFNMVHITRDGNVLSYTPTTDATGTYAFINALEGDLVEVDWVETTYVNTYLQSYVTTKQLVAFPIPMGFFTVKNCSRQASTGIIKATCYNKLQSDYLDQKANADIISIVSGGEPGIDDGMTYYYLMNKLLSDYSIDNRDDSDIVANVTGEGLSWVPHIESAPGTSDVAEEYVTFRLFRHDPIAEEDRTLGFFTFGRRVATANVRLPSQASSSATETLPREYNRAIFDENIAQHIRDGFEEVFGDYVSDEDYTYYLQPTSMDDIYRYFASIISPGSWSDMDRDKPYDTNKGTAYTIEEIRASLDSQDTLWPTAFSSGYYLHDTYIDSDFKGLVAIDRDHTGAGYEYPDLRIKTETPVGALPSYIFPQFITPLQTNSTDYYWNEYDISSASTACNCAYLVLPSQVYALMRSTSDEEYHSIYQYPWNTDGAYDYKLELKHKEVSTIEKSLVTEAQVEAWADVTLRSLQSAIYETSCCFGQLSRETDLFSGVELNRSRLLPQETLYPSESLYPGGAKASGFKSMYSKLWADEGNIRKWKYLIITYKGLDSGGNETECTLQRTVNADGTDNYNCSDNWLFKNLVWTAEQIGAYADAMVAKMRNITWFPFEMWCAGLPYLETGDEIEIPFGEGKYTSYVLQRQLKGIQDLQDTYINGTLDIF